MGAGEWKSNVAQEVGHHSYILNNLGCHVVSLLEHAKHINYCYLNNVMPT
jgi:hypothetical protein